ncbi:MAG: ADOP family duplicated permease, partial [Gemmatimonadaceae bacterium]
TMTPVAVRLLLRCLPLAERDEARADLVAEYRARVATHGRGRAERWAWTQFFRSLLPLSSRTWRRANTGFDPGANVMNPGGPFVERWLLDARYALRRLRTRPGYSALAVLTLALGVGGMAAISGIVRTLLLDQLPYPHSEQLVQFWRPGDWRAREVTLLRHQWNGFSGVAAYRQSDATLERPGAPARLVPGIASSAELFQVLGVTPLMGRGFARGEDLPGAAPVAVLSYSLWRDLGQDTRIVGSTVVLDGTPRTVIGVMPQRFWFPDPAVGVWTADTINATGGVGFYTLVGRMAPGRRIESMQPAVDRVTKLLAASFTYTKQWDITTNAVLTSVRETMVKEMRPPLFATLAGMAAILLIACANVAALVLGQIESRSTELAVRAALGADRTRLAAQVLTEIVVVGLAAGIVGALIAAAGFGLLRGTLPLGAWRDRTAIDWTLLAVSIAVATISSLAIALFPILALWRRDLRATLAGARTNGFLGRRGGLQGVMIVAEVAVAAVLASTAGLIVHSVSRLYDVRPGIDVRGVAVVDIATPGGTPGTTRLAMMHRVLDALGALPDVRAVGATQRIPLRGSGWTMGLRLANVPADAPSPRFRIVSGNYFAAAGIPVRRGRAFSSADLTADSVASIVVNETLVKLYFPNVDPIGQMMPGGLGKPERIVGVVGDVAEGSLTEPMPPTRYYFADRVSFVPSGQTILIRTARAGDAQRMLAEARRVIARVAPSMAVENVTTLQRVLDTAVGPARDVMKLLGVLTTVALVLGAIGIYGVISQYVARRNRDWSIRVALVLSPARVVALIIRHGLALVVVGLAAGLAATLISARLLSAFLFGVSSHDPLALAGAAASLVAVGLLAALVPAIRAARTDPALVLREQ